MVVTPTWSTCLKSWLQHRATHLKKLSPRQVTSIPFDKANISLIYEVDEQWSFVGKKKNRC